MDTRISVVLDIINSVKALNGRFQINQHQCKRLSDFYNRAGQFFGQLKEHLNSQRLHSLPSLDVITSVLQKGQLLVEKYTEEDWFESMLTAGVNQDSFVAIHVELESCIRSIYEVVKHRLGSRMPEVPLMKLRTVAPILFLDEDDRVTLFKGDAEKDKKYMLGKIESRKITTSKARNSNLSTEEKSYEIRSLDMASEKISEIIDQQRIGTQRVLPSYLSKKKKLPSYLRIESSEIEVGDLIGSGGSAEVHKCRWLHRDYAVKIFRANDVVGLRKEVENLVPLRHPNIVLLVGFSIRRSDSSPMVVMELLDCDLHTLIHTDSVVVAPKMRPKWRRNTTTFNSKQLVPFPIWVAVDFIYQIATGMTYLHKRKLFHGDLKALNVLVKRHQAGWELKISDFGVSDELVLKDDHIGYESDCTSFSTANVGTTRWRAPEVFDVTGGGVLKPYSMKADVYSFAMTCVEILTRQVPFHYMPTKDIKNHVKAGYRPELPSNIPGDLRKLIVRCWDKDPTRRPDFSEICTYMQGVKEHSLPLDMEEMGVNLEVLPRVFFQCSIL